MACPPAQSQHEEESALSSYILTGASGAGKTAILRLLEVSGYPVVKEAATDVIGLGEALGRTEQCRQRDFVEKIVTWQRQRLDSAPGAERGVVFHDRSLVCTLALSRWLGLARQDCSRGKSAGW